MKIDPGFPDHWKTRMLYNALGAEAVLALLRLWGSAQISREWQGLDLSPKKLKAICGFPGCDQKLWDAFTDCEFPWLDQSPDGTYSIHGFEEHQAQVIALWKNGHKGGRPPKPKSIPSLPPSPTHPLTPHGSHAVESEKPNGFRLVSNQEPPAKKSKAKGTADELKAYAVELGMPASDGEWCFDKWEGNGWKNDGKPIADWKATMRVWKRSRYLASQKSASPPAGTEKPREKTRSLTSDQVGI